MPPDLKEGALALGTTRWEMVRGVVFPYARGGIAAAFILGLGRALGEAIAVTQVIGGGPYPPGTCSTAGDTLASQHRRAYIGAVSEHPDFCSLVYLALILLVFSLLTNVSAQSIVRRVARRQGLGLNCGRLGRSRQLTKPCSARAPYAVARSSTASWRHLRRSRAARVAVLVIVVTQWRSAAAAAISLDFFTKTPSFRGSAVKQATGERLVGSSCSSAGDS